MGECADPLPVLLGQCITPFILSPRFRPIVNFLAITWQEEKPNITEPRRDFHTN